MLFTTTQDIETYVPHNHELYILTPQSFYERLVLAYRMVVYHKKFLVLSTFSKGHFENNPSFTKVE